MPVFVQPDSNDAFLEEVVRQERENMERMQRMAKKDIQNVVIQELEAKLSDYKGKKRQEESAARLKELMKERDAALAARKKEASKKQEKSQEVRERAQAALAERNEEMTQTLQKAAARAEQKLADVAAAHEEAKAKNDERRRLISERQANYERDLLRGRESAYREHCAKHEAKLEKLAEALAQRQSNAEAIALKQQKTMENVRNHLVVKQADTEKRYFEICGRHETAAQKREENLKALVKEYSVRNNKRRQGHESRMDRLTQELEENPGMKLCASSAPGSPKFVPERADMRRSKSSLGNREGALVRSASDSRIQEVAERHQRHVELVAENREKLRSGHHVSVEQQLNKLRGMRRKVQIMEDSRAEADRRRMVVMRNCAVEKMHLTERVNRIKNSKNPDKMYQMLEDLDPDRDAVIRINELLGELGMERLGGFKEGDEETK